MYILYRVFYFTLFLDFLKFKTWKNKKSFFARNRILTVMLAQVVFYKVVVFDYLKPLKFYHFFLEKSEMSCLYDLESTYRLYGACNRNHSVQSSGFVIFVKNVKIWKCCFFLTVAWAQFVFYKVVVFDQFQVFWTYKFCTFFEKHFRNVMS